MSDTTRVGWIGTGVMGLSMCGHLQAKGHPVTVYSRTKSKRSRCWTKAPRGPTRRPASPPPRT